MDDNEFQKYMASRFLQPNGTFKNRLGITNEAELEKTEYRMVAESIRQALRHKVKIRTTDDIVKMHKFLFGQIYDWAGEKRDTTENGKIPYDLNKKGHDFLPAVAMNQGEYYINVLLKQANQQKKIKPELYGQLLNNINDWHPFREGNGRTTKTALQCLAKEHGQTLQFDRHQKEMIKLLNQGDNSKVNKAIGNLMHVDTIAHAKKIAKEKQKQDEIDIDY